MSYDIFLQSKKCSECGHQEGVSNLPGPTYNLTPIFHLALTGQDVPNPNVSEFASVILGEAVDTPRGLRVLSGKQASDSVATIENAMLYMLKEPDKFRKLEPANGWGTYDVALQVLNELLEAAKTHPSYIWEIR